MTILGNSDRRCPVYCHPIEGYYGLLACHNMGERGRGQALTNHLIGLNDTDQSSTSWNRFLSAEGELHWQTYMYTCTKHWLPRLNSSQNQFVFVPTWWSFNSHSITAFYLQGTLSLSLSLSLALFLYLSISLFLLSTLYIPHTHLSTFFWEYSVI